MVGRILLAVALGGVIGFEREIKHRPAGLRTHMLVSLGATIFTLISVSFAIDPARIAAGIVTGIGFLGAGSIISTRGHMHGITTAATLWIVASIGLSVGVGQYWIAIISTIVVFAILQIKRVEEKITTKENET
ncbi:MAG: MgtC/SapB family protein [Thaumarchaeota archaeon]|nr:MgtC/SapB family protein [Nitrososphaerota archaeon]